MNPTDAPGDADAADDGAAEGADAAEVPPAVPAPVAPPVPEGPSDELLAYIKAIAEVPIEDRGPFLWRVQSKKKKHKGVAVLYGSIHLGKTDMYPLPTEVEAAFAAADRLAVEMDLSDPEMEARMGQELLTIGRLPEGQTIKDLLPERYEELKTGLWRMGIPMVFMENMTPFMIGMTYTVVEMTRAGWNPELGIDKYFLNKARAQGKTIVELEGLERQLAVFREMPMAAQLSMLKSTLDMAGATDAWTQRAWAALLAGDDRALLRLSDLEDSDTEEYDAYEEVLLGDRNVEMAAKIAEHIETGDDVMFVVVGALHLPGDDGLVALLGKNKKFKVARLPRAAE